jgi:hypothetical protein
LSRRRHSGEEGALGQPTEAKSALLAEPGVADALARAEDAVARLEAAIAAYPDGLPGWAGTIGSSSARLRRGCALPFWSAPGSRIDALARQGEGDFERGDLTAPRRPKTRDPRARSRLRVDVARRVLAQ